jgi:hypothetical protein
MDLAEFLGPIEREAVQRSEPIRAVLESTTNSRAIQRRLTEYGRAAGLDLTAEVLDARKIRIIAESVCKCDRLDAKVLGELARSNLKLPTCYMPDDEEFALRDGGPSLTLRVAATGVTCLESGREFSRSKEAKTGLLPGGLGLTLLHRGFLCSRV